MHFTTSVLAALAVIAPALAQQDIDYSDMLCIGSCFVDSTEMDWLDSQCDGGELGDDLIKCTCDSIKAADFYGCMQECPKEQKDEYAKALEGTCPDIFSGSSGGGDDGDDEEDDGDSEATTTDSDSASATEEANADETDAAIRNGPGLLIAGGFIAALLI